MPSNFDRPPNFDRIARPYRWLEYLTFGPILEHCRFHFIPEVQEARRALVLGDGDGRFLARMLTTNPTLHADVVDLSPTMLALLRARITRIGAVDRVTLCCADATAFTPSGSYDLIVTHFFLDCFTTEQLERLSARIRPHLLPNARWIVSEFAIPSGPMSLPARFIIRGLYAAFRLLTGLRIHSLPDHAAALAAAGLTVTARHCWLGGLLISELWEFPGNQSRPH
jgi:ubiquinone/menaquinone biosynthesis C-methylase UbiE